MRHAGADEQGFHLVLVAPGALGREPAPALVVEVLPVIGRIGLRSRLPPRLGPTAPATARLDLARKKLENYNPACTIEGPGTLPARRRRGDRGRAARAH